MKKTLNVSPLLYSPHLISLCLSFLSSQGPFSLLTLILHFLPLFIQPALTLWRLNRLSARDFSVFVFRVVNGNGVIN